MNQSRQLIDVIITGPAICNTFGAYGTALCEGLANKTEWIPHESYLGFSIEDIGAVISNFSLSRERHTEVMRLIR